MSAQENEPVQDVLTQLQGWGEQAWRFAETEILVWSRLTELGLLVAVAFAAGFLARRLRGPMGRMPDYDIRFLRFVRGILLEILPGLIAWLLLLIALPVFKAVDTHDPVIVFTAQRLLSAWLVIQLASSIVRSQAMRRLIAWSAWGIAALAILGWLDPLTEALGAMELGVGSISITALAILQGAIALFILMWLSVTLSEEAERWLGRIPHVTPSTQVLLSKLLRIVLFGAAFLIALNAVGIDLTALAVFGGALGVGIGLGLQKVVSNFVSGLILLADRSIKPGDVIEVGDTYGSINRLGARFVSVITRDGKEHLIPNEDLITTPVINWSFSDKIVRVKLPIGISYSCDVKKAMTLAVASAKAVPRVLEDPAPRCLLVGFGESSVDLELRVWIRDPEDGVRNVSSDVLLEVWDRFHAAEIVFPFPHRVVEIVQPKPEPEAEPEDAPAE